MVEKQLKGAPDQLGAILETNGSLNTATLAKVSVVKWNLF
jgi:hypothetical protein